MTALVTYLLLELLKDKTGSNKSLLEIQRLINICIYKPINNLIKKLNKEPSRESKGRRKANYDEMFKLTLQQAKEGDSGYFYQKHYYDWVI